MMKYALKHVDTGKYVECLQGSDGCFKLCHKLDDAARFSGFPGLIRFVAGHRTEIQNYTIVGARRAGWQECSPFHHPNDCIED